MKKLTINFKLTGKITDPKKWPRQGEDYGYVIYQYGEHSHVDSGGYLMSYLWALLEHLVNVFPANEDYVVTSLDGDFGLDVKPGNDVRLRIYSGWKNIHTTTMTKKEFYELCLDTFENYLLKLNDLDPTLKDSLAIQKLMDFKKKIQIVYSEI